MTWTIIAVIRVRLASLIIGFIKLSAITAWIAAKGLQIAFVRATLCPPTAANSIDVHFVSLSPVLAAANHQGAIRTKPLLWQFRVEEYLCGAAVI